MTGLQSFIERSGLTKEVARIIWHATRRPETRCAICGVPGHRLAAYERKHSPCPSFHRNHSKLEVDRITPGAMGGEYTMDNIRPLCPKCNFLRGAARRSDHEVRMMMWRKWSAFEDINHLRWFESLAVCRSVYTPKGDHGEGSTGA